MTRAKVRQRSSRLSEKPLEKTMTYRMPAEWEPHRATWLAWPHDRVTWPKELPDLERTYVEMIEYLHEGEEVCLLVREDQTIHSVQKQLAERGIRKNVSFHKIDTDSPRTRDYGPIF